MITGKEDLLQSLMEAFLMEKGTKEFYSGAAGKAVNEAAQKTFKDLSAWEEKHMDFIEYLYLSVQGDRDIAGFDEFKEKAEAPITEAGIPVKHLEHKLGEFQITEDRGAIALALDIEGKAYNLYRSMSERAVDTNAKVVFREMMEQEQKHIEYLMKTRDRLAQTA